MVCEMKVPPVLFAVELVRANFVRRRQYNADWRRLLPNGLIVRFHRVSCAWRQIGNDSFWGVGSATREDRPGNSSAKEQHQNGEDSGMHERYPFTHNFWKRLLVPRGFPSWVVTVAHRLRCYFAVWGARHSTRDTNCARIASAISHR
jgi:hypothetical protein